MASDTCNCCGKLVEVETLDDDDMCTACTEEESDDTCPVCQGCGEGQHEGTRCYLCHGKGVLSAKSDDFDEPDDDDRDDYCPSAAYEELWIA